MGYEVSPEHSHKGKLPGGMMYNSLEELLKKWQPQGKMSARLRLTLLHDWIRCSLSPIYSRGLEICWLYYSKHMTIREPGMD